MATKAGCVFCKSYFSVLFLFCFFVHQGLGVLRPRGVPLSKKIFYDPNQKFSCLDGSGVIAFHFVNDDFCDCDDGSDEPGTSACPQGEFVCSNYGHTSITMPSSRVNDGICDCCDGSDEFNSSADCLNNCRELGLHALKTAKAVFQQYTEGNETRQSYILEAREKKEEYQKELNNLQKKEQEYLRSKLQKQDLKERAEDRERTILGIQKQMKKEREKRRMKEKKILQEQKLQDSIGAKKAFEMLDLNKNGKLSILEVKSFSKFDYDGDESVSDQEAQFYMHKKDELTYDEFISTTWRTMKAAFTMEDADDDYINAKSPKTQQIPNSKPEMDEDERNAAFEEAALRRKEFADANKLLQDVQADIWNVKKKLTADYGPEDEFLALENSCFDFIDKRYLYKLCLFDKAVQVFRSNMNEVLLGLWENWCGKDGNLYSKMNFTRGSSCWNGPSRSVLVNLECGLENKLSYVIETSPCVYVYVFETPAFCKDIPPDVEELLNINNINL